MKRLTGEIIVPFRNRRFILIFSGLILVGYGIVLHLKPSDWAFNALGWFALILAGAYSFFWISRNLRKTPALIISSEGVMNATGLLRKSWYPWNEIKKVYFTGNPWMYQRQMAFVTKHGTFWVSENIIGITIDELKNIILEVGDFQGKIGVHRGYKNSNLTMGSLVVNFFLGLLLAVGVIGAICIPMLNRQNIYFLLFPILFLVITAKMINWYFPVNFNPRFRNRLPLPMEYFILTSASAVVLTIVTILGLSSWIGDEGGVVLGFLLWWILADRYLKRKYGIKLI
jgi:hypothetical protein